MANEGEDVNRDLNPHDDKKKKYRFIIKPDESTFKTYWDTITAMCLTISLLFIPYT
jgi:hypothetical protein